MCLLEAKKMGKREWYSRILLDFLKKSNKKYFKVKHITKDIGLNRWEIIEGLKVLKADGAVEKVANTTWQFLQKV